VNANPEINEPSPERSEPASLSSPIERARRLLMHLLVHLLVVLLVGLLPGGRVRHEPPPQDEEALPQAAVKAPLRIALIDRETRAALRGKVRVFYRKGDAFLLFGEAETDATGLATAAAPPGDLLVIAEAQGRARQSKRLILLAEARDLTFELGAETPVYLSVFSEVGEALPGAQVEVRGSDSAAIGARADKAGLVEVRGLGLEAFTVFVRMPGYETRSIRSTALAPAGAPLVSSPSAPMRVTLRPLAAALVTVLDTAGAPVAEARVRLASASLWPPQEALTQRDGTLRIAGLKAGMYAVRADKDTRVSSTEYVSLLGTSSDEPVKLELRPGVMLTVRARDEEALAISGVQVSVRENGLTAFPLDAITDKRGVATVGPFGDRATLGAHGATVVASKEGYVPYRDTPVAGPEMDIVLQTGGVIEGRVVDGRGHPVGGAVLRLTGTDGEGRPLDEGPGERGFAAGLFAARGVTRSFAFAGSLGVVPVPTGLFGGPAGTRGRTASFTKMDPQELSKVFGPSGSRGGGAAGAPGRNQDEQDSAWTTARDGTFRLTAVPPGRLRLLCTHAEYTQGSSDYVVVLPNGRTTATIVLSRGGDLEGKLRFANGSPAGGYTVRAEASDGSSLQDTTASDGSFVFRSLAARVTLTVIGKQGVASRELLQETVDVQEGKRANVVLTLPEERDAVVVTVLNRRGDPVPHAHVTAESLVDSEPGRAAGDANARGEVSLAGLRGLRARLRVRAQGYADLLTELAPEAQGKRVTLIAGERLLGRVVTRRGDPIASAEVELVGTAERAITGKDGSFEIRDIAPGERVVRVRAEGMSEAKKTAQVREDSLHRGTDMGAVELQSEAIVEGQVVDSDGRPVLGARVALGHAPVLVLANAQDGLYTTTNARGQFRLRGLPAGAHVVEAFAAGTGRGETQVALQAGGSARQVVIKLAALPKGEVVERTAASGSLAVTLGERGETVVIAHVAEGSGAANAGLQEGDEIIAVDRTPVAKIEKARALLDGAPAQDVWLDVRRDGQILRVRAARDAVRK
jgi:Carboxypeptidase regulatory-like domain/PDZ domain